MKKTVSTYGYCSPLRWNTPSQNSCVLLTTPTMRQSWRSFASAPVRHSSETTPGVVALPDLLILERRKLPEPAAAREQAEQEVDDEHAKPDAPAADREPAPAAASADVGDLAGIEFRSLSETHGGFRTREGLRPSTGSVPCRSGSP